jgi:hypothetical protein
MLAVAGALPWSWETSKLDEDLSPVQVLDPALTCAAWGLAVAFVTKLLKIA